MVGICKLQILIIFVLGRGRGPVSSPSLSFFLPRGEIIEWKDKAQQTTSKDAKNKSIVISLYINYYFLTSKMDYAYAHQIFLLIPNLSWFSRFFWSCASHICLGLASAWDRASSDLISHVLLSKSSVRESIETNLVQQKFLCLIGRKQNEVVIDDVRDFNDSVAVISSFQVPLKLNIDTGIGSSI